MNWNYWVRFRSPRFAVRTFMRQWQKRVLKRDSSIRLPNGVTMHLPKNSTFGSEVFVSNCDVDWGAEPLFMKHLDQKGVFLDVGANIGYYSLLASTRAAQVYSFEPDPRTQPSLERNAKTRANIEVVRMAVFSKPGEMAFDNTVDSALAHLEQGGNGSKASLKVPVTTVDEFRKDRLKDRKVRGIKIDVEGADFDVLLGARAAMAEDEPLVLTEFHAINDGHNNSSALFDLITPMGYRVFCFTKPARPSGVMRPRYGFCEATPHNITKLKYKMLFLVPPRLHAPFVERAAKGR